jgi:hypothetical protein
MLQIMLNKKVTTMATRLNKNNDITREQIQELHESYTKITESTFPCFLPLVPLGPANMTNII